MLKNIRSIGFVCLLGALVLLPALPSFAQPAGGCAQPTVGSPVAFSFWSATSTLYLCNPLTGQWYQMWDPSDPQVATTTLTAANILAMNGTPVTVLPAPGAGKAYLIHRILWEMTTTATQFASGGTVQFQYHGGAVVHSGTIPASVVTATAGTTYTMLGGAAAANGTTVLANTAIEVTNNTAAFTTGTGTAYVQIWYSIVTL